MKTLIIEDEGASRRRLEGIINSHPNLKLAGSASSGLKAIQLINSTPADLLLMDIQLKDMTAFEILNTIEKDFSGKIIFVTAYNNFAIKAFEVFAIDYVLKPYTDERILKAVDRISLNKKEPKKEILAILESLHFPEKICIPEGKTSHLFTPNEIVWIEADGYHSKVHFDSGNFQLIRILLKDLTQILPENFIRINRSVIINKTHVVSYKKDQKETVFVLGNEKVFSGTPSYLDTM